MAKKSRQFFGLSSPQSVLISLDKILELKDLEQFIYDVSETRGAAVRIEKRKGVYIAFVDAIDTLFFFLPVEPQKPPLPEPLTLLYCVEKTLYRRCIKRFHIKKELDNAPKKTTNEVDWML